MDSYDDGDNNNGDVHCDGLVVMIAIEVGVILMQVDINDESSGINNDNCISRDNNWWPAYI